MIARGLLLTALVALSACEKSAETPLLPAGQPCLTVPVQEAQARGYVFRQKLQMGPTLIERQGGRADCTAEGTSGEGGRDGVPVCKMSGPGATRITTPSGETYFDIPLGVPATIIVVDGQARCVLDQGQKQ